MLSATVAIVGRSFTLSRNIAARLEGLIAYGATARISLFIEFANLDRGDEHPFVFVVFGRRGRDISRMSPVVSHDVLHQRANQSINTNVAARDHVRLVCVRRSTTASVDSPGLRTALGPRYQSDHQRFQRLIGVADSNLNLMADGKRGVCSGDGRQAKE